MFEKIKKILRNTFISTFSHTFTVLTKLLIVNIRNILTDGSSNKTERESLQRQCLKWRLEIIFCYENLHNQSE